jgi:hypothetical protein
MLHVFVEEELALSAVADLVADLVADHAADHGTADRTE